MQDKKFVDKLLERFDKLDRDTIQSYVNDLAREKEMLRGILDELPEGIIVLGSKGEVRTVNRPAKWLLGYSTSKEFKGNLINHIKDSEIKGFISKSLRTARRIVAHEIDVLFPKEMTVSVGVFPRCEGTEHKSTIIIIANVTDRIEQEREKRKLEHIESLVSLAAGVAHEIGNPLNAIMIHLNLLSREIQKSDCKNRGRLQENVTVIKTEAARLDNIVKEFLRATSRKPVKLKNADINRVLENAINILQPEIRESDVNIETDIDDVPEFLFDCQKMHQVFVNLIKNAVQAMPEGGKLSIGLKTKDNLCFALFKDTGEGIPEDELPRIFDAYFTTKNEGSGLGLMNVYNIVKEHGGRIEVSSKTGKGSTFTIILPMRREKLLLPMEVKIKKI